MTKTKKEMFTELKALVVDNAEMVAFIDHELELLSRKKTNSGKPTVKEIENEKLKNEILEYMEFDTKYTITDIQKALGIESNQKASALVRQLRLDGKVDRVEEKRKAYFFKLPNVD